MQNSEDESFLRRVLYDVILVDYSFVHPERLVDLPSQRIKSLIISRLVVTHEAAELFRYENRKNIVNVQVEKKKK